MCYFLMEKTVHLASLRLWKQGVPAIKAWCKSAGDRELVQTYSEIGIGCVLFCNNETDWRSRPSVSVHMWVCACLSQNPDGSSKPLTVSSLQRHMPSFHFMPSFKVRVFLIFCSFSFAVHSFIPSMHKKAAYKLLAILATTLRSM